MPTSRREQSVCPSETLCPSTGADQGRRGWTVTAEGWKLRSPGHGLARAQGQASLRRSRLRTSGWRRQQECGVGPGLCSPFPCRVHLPTPIFPTAIGAPVSLWPGSGLFCSTDNLPVLLGSCLEWSKVLVNSKGSVPRTCLSQSVRVGMSLELGTPPPQVSPDRWPRASLTLWGRQDSEL